MSVRKANQINSLSLSFFGFLNKPKNSKMFYKNVREECIRKLGIAELSGSSVCCYGRSDYLNLTTVLINRDRAS